MGNIIEFTTEDVFQKEVMDYSGAVLVDFWAPWCGPCKMITPVVDELAEKFAGKVKVCKVNVDEGNALAEKLEVMGVPSLIFFVGGKEVQRIVGNRPEELKAAFEALSGDVAGKIDAAKDMLGSL